MTLITHSSILKRADELAVGDIIPGGNAAKGHRVVAVKDGHIDDMLGLVTIVTVERVAMDEADQEFQPILNYLFRPYDKLWIDA